MPTSLRAVVMFVCVASSSFMLAQPTVRWTFDGSNANDWMGTTVANAGDVDGDGLADILTGALVDEFQPGLGYARVFSGGTGQLIHEFVAENPGDFYGWHVNTAGDVDLDGTPDIIVGAPRFRVGGQPVGRAYVYSGATGLPLHIKTGQAAGDSFGYAVAFAGDVNADGHADFMVGARLADGNQVDSGKVYVYSGANGSLLYQKSGEGLGDSFGTGVGSAGDLNGDGHSEFMVGAIFNNGGGFHAGRAYLYSGINGQLLHTWDGDGVSSPTGVELGTAVESVGDINGDGVNDLVISAKETDIAALDAGRVYVISGATYQTIYTWDGEFAADQFGQDAAAAGDVDGDGVPDIVVGADSYDNGGPGSGRIYVYSGATGLLMFTYTGPGPEDGLGSAVSGGGDVDGDGRADVIGGAFGDGTFQPFAGRTYVFHAPGSGGTTLGGCAVGNAGGDLLTLNGSFGGAARRIDIGRGFPLSLSLAQPGLFGAASHHLLFAKLGVPTAQSVTNLPAGLGTMCFSPCLLAPAPDGVTLTNTLGAFPGCPSVFAASLTPWTSPYIMAPTIPLDFVVQGVVQTGLSTFAVTNAVLVHVP